MAFFSQGASSIADCNAITISMWAELPSPAPSTVSNSVFFGLLEFGGLGPFDLAFITGWSWDVVGTITNSGVQGQNTITGCETCGAVLRGSLGFLETDPSTDPFHGFYGYYVDLAFNNTQDVYQATPSYSGSLPAKTSWLGVIGAQSISSPNNPYRIAGFIQGSPLVTAGDPDTISVPYLEINPVTIASSKFNFGTWNHFLFAIDTHDGKMVDPDTGASSNAAYLVHNGNTIWGGSAIAANRSFYGSDQVSKRGPGIPVSDWPICLPLNPLASPTYPFSQNYDYTGGSFTQANLIKRRYGDVQVWFNTFIDPTIPANFAKFINITEGKGYPVNPSVAAASFGQQTILFKGKASDNSFFVNRGSGGAFTKVGTASDFTPTPSYG